MATQGERRALFFLAAVAVLGAGTRAWRARRPAGSSAPVDAQIAAIDSAKTQPRGARRPSARRESAFPHAVDLDTAPAGEIERLSGIGPSLAKRIVADRAAKGAFRCLAALDRVKGVGPALLARLDSVVTFSGAGQGPCETPAPPPAGRPPG